MAVIKLTDGIPENYTIEQLLIDVPDAVIYKKTELPNEELLKNYNVYPLITSALPNLHINETAEEGLPVFENGEWLQVWVIRKLSDEEIQEIVRTTEITLNLAHTTKNHLCEECSSLTELKECLECQH